MRHVVALEEVDSQDVVGGKAGSLARLAGAGLPVPHGVVVTGAAFEEALREAGLYAEALAVEADPSGAGALRQAIATMPLPTALQHALAQKTRSLRAPLAVRSSAVDEDGAHSSFAGQHRTDLGVDAGGLHDALRACWASLYAEGAVAYRRGSGPPAAGMAVVVQEMVQPSVSGVLFTVNPLSGSWREMTVEAVYGLGEPLVSGTITPHWYLVRRPRRAPRPVARVLSRVRLHPVDQDLPALRTQRIGQPPRDVPVPADRQQRPTLDRRTLLRLCRLGLKVEALSGEPQDIEWAIDASGAVRLLQSRPITRRTPERPRSDVLWTRRFIGERWSEPATPLGWSLMEPVLAHFIHYPRTQQRYLGGGPPLKLVRGRPYVNATAFRHLAFKLPGAPAPQFITELLPPADEASWQRRFAAAPDISVYLSFLRETVQEQRWTRFRFNPLTNPAAWRDYRQRLDKQLPAWQDDPADADAALARVREQQTWVVEYVGVHLCSLLFANLCYQLLHHALAAHLPEQAAELMNALAVCPPGNRTVQTNAALWELARRATPAQLDRLAAGKLPRGAFREALDRFLAEYGHRSAASWELFTPRWADDPAQLVPLLRAFADGSAPDPTAREEAQQGAAQAALNTVRDGTDGLTRAWLLLLVDYTRRYLLLRENQRFSFDRLLASQQATLRWLGAAWSEAGLLAAPGDIAYLSWDEVQRLAAGQLAADSAQEAVSQRRATRQADADATRPVFLEGEAEARAALPDDTPRLQGLGISPGRASGPVVVVRSLADAARVTDGSVLVARAVDPGWTPLFGKAAAVVLELGSRLSHGAVVAREYGLPAVVNLDGITERLRDGQQVTVDGTRGVVWVEKP